MVDYLWFWLISYRYSEYGQLAIDAQSTVD